MHWQAWHLLVLRNSVLGLGNMAVFGCLRGMACGEAKGQPHGYQTHPLHWYVWAYCNVACKQPWHACAAGATSTQTLINQHVHLCVYLTFGYAVSY